MFLEDPIQPISEEAGPAATKNWDVIRTTSQYDKQQTNFALR